MNRGFIAIRVCNTYVKISMFAPPVAVVSVITGMGTLYLSTMLAIGMHELGHIVAAIFFGGSVSEVRVLPYGLNATLSDGMGMAERVVVYSSGPVASMLLFIMFKAGSNLIGHGYMAYAAGINLFVGLINMIPVLPLDGGKLLREILGIKMGMGMAGRHLRRITYVAVSAAAVIAAATALSGRFNINLWIAGLFIITVSGREEMEGRLMKMKNILKRRTLLDKKGVYPVRHIAALSTVKLGEVIKHMDFDRLHVIYVLSSDTSIMGKYTEQQIIDGALKYGSSITLGHYIREFESGREHQPDYPGYVP